MKKTLINTGLTIALVFSVLSPSYSVISSAEAAEFTCSEYKTKVSGKSAKEAASDAPSWVKGQRPCRKPINEDGGAFAKRLLDEKYGAGNYKKGAASEFSKTKKYGQRSFE